MTTVGNATNLFRPVPPSTLQSNLAEHYKRTSEFVSDQFEELTGPDQQPQQKSTASNDVLDRNEERVRPMGVGANIDIYV